MKNYRRLAPGEVIRSGDVTPGNRPSPFVGLTIECSPRGHVVQYRKARTDGCPPGWRWADAGERPGHHVVSHRGDREPKTNLKGGPSPVLMSKDETNRCGTFVMPYPEDPRLEE